MTFFSDARVFFDARSALSARTSKFSTRGNLMNILTAIIATIIMATAISTTTASGAPDAATIGPGEDTIEQVGPPPTFDEGRRPCLACGSGIQPRQPVGGRR
jgi:hypothetical protein